jgi:hypothetical protein
MTDNMDTEGGVSANGGDRGPGRFGWSTIRRLVLGDGLSRKRAIVGIVAIVLIAGSVTGTLLVTVGPIHLGSKNNGDGGSDGTGGTRGNATSTQSSANAAAYQRFTKETDQLGSTGEYDKQAQKIEDYLATNGSTLTVAQQAEQKYKLAAAYINTANYQKAIDVLKALPKLDEKYTVDSYHGQALAYAKLGDNQSAIDAYKKAIAALRSANNPDNTAQAIAMDEQAIKLLGGTP